MQKKSTLYSVIKQGSLFGMFFGLIVSFFDGLFMLVPNIQIPTEYPAAILGFNLCFWALTGTVISLILWLLFRNRIFFQHTDNRYMSTFFLFILIYGVLGRVDIVGLLSPAFDYHLSVLWSLCILVFMAISSKKTDFKKSSPVSFLPETIAIIALFMLCSNIERIQWLSGCFDKVCPQFILSYANSYDTYLVLKKYFLTLVNIAAVAFILAVYAITILKFKFLFTRRDNKLLTLFITVTVVCSLYASYRFSHDKFLKENYPCLTAPQNITANHKIPYVILAVLDTVRADHLSVYGTPGTTPNLEKFAQDGFIFNNCIASSPWTLPSHVSLFTGLFPSEHGSHHNPLRKKKWPLTRLPEKFQTLAGIFRNNGYQTCGVVSNCILLHKGLRFNRGFNCYDSSQSIGSAYRFPFRPILPLFCYLTNTMTEYFLPNRPAERINNNTFYFLDKVKPSPFFLFLNYMDAHAPYCPPRPFNSFFSDKYFPHAYRIKQDLLALFGANDKEKKASFDLSQYDGEIAYLDHHLGKLFAKLKNMGIYDKSLIIITSDHGELFDEHGLSGHECAMYEGVVRVPLIVKFPANIKPDIQQEKPIVLSDLFTTILSLCSLPIPENVSGKTFDNLSDYTVSEFYNYDTGINRALYYKQYKLMKYERNNKPELYDLEGDPQEKINLYTKLPLIAEKMENTLGKWNGEHKLQAGNKKDSFMSREIRDGLKALGYIK